MLVITAITTAAIFYTNILSLLFILVLQILILLPVLSFAILKSKFLTLNLKIMLLNNNIIYDNFKAVLKLILIIKAYFIL